jgi:TPR repeat protein
MPAAVVESLLEYVGRTEWGSLVVPLAVAALTVLFIAGLVEEFPNFLRGQRAFYWLRLAALKGLPPARTAMGVCYYKGLGIRKDPEAAMACFRAAASDSNFAPAQYALGYVYRKKGKKYYGDAVRWFTESADVGLAAAQFSLGKCYEYNVVPKRDDNIGKAHRWYEIAAAQGHHDAKESECRTEKKKSRRTRSLSVAALAGKMDPTIKWGNLSAIS